MSGLSAIVTFDRRVRLDDAERMVAAVPHRSGLGDRWWTSEAAVLAELARQQPGSVAESFEPAHSADRSVVVVADARIDNSADVMAGLSRGDPGYHDQPTDTEVILAAYLRWGVAAAEHLIGDFAFVVWDATERRVFAARDPMAMRPLYFRVEPHRRAVFASEAKQILAASDVPRTINERAVAHHLLSRFDPLQWSFYDGIEVLAPGHSIVVAESGRRTWRHWDFDPNREITYRTEDEYVDHFRDLVLAAVRSRVRPGPPVGVLLSGGMDSGTAAGAACWLRSIEPDSVPKIRAYTWDFGDLVESDERHISRHLVDHFGIEETAIPVAGLGPLAEYPLHGPDPDTPFLGAFQPALEQSLDVAAAEGCGAVMSGDRGDLVSGALVVNYPNLLRTRRWRQLGRQLRRHREVTGESMRTILLGDLIAPAAQRLLRKPNRTSATQQPVYPAWLRQDFATRCGITDEPGEVDSGPNTMPDYYRERRRRLILEPMHMRGMMWTDRTHARAGLRFVDPWSDRRLAEFVVAIPQQVINRPERNDKQLARKAMVGILPDSFLATASKILPTPLYRKGLFDEGSATVHRLLQDSRSSALGYIDDDIALAAYEQARRGGPDPYPIWRLICVEMWLRAHWDVS